MALSAEHASAVGAYGQLYVWGQNTYIEDRNETQTPEETEKSHSSEESEEESTHPKKGVSGKIGFVNNDFLCLDDPTYFSLTHPLYKVNATQVACGLNFTAVIAVEKPNVLQDSTPNELLFSLEVDDRAIDYSYESYKELSKEEFDGAILSNKLRIEITDFLSKKNASFMNFFKSRIIKEYTFLDLMKNQVKTLMTEDEVKKIIDHKKMRLPGNDIKLKPLYEIIMKTHQGQGILYLIGDPSIVPKDSINHMIAQTIRENNLSYFIVNLPSQLVVTKVCCGDQYVIILGENGMVYSWGQKFNFALGKNRSSTYNQIRAVSGLVTEKTKIIDIASGSSHCIALNDSGVVMTWGEGTLGKLGNGRYDPCSRPEPINLDSKEPAMIKAFGNTSFCLMKDNSGYFWGENNRQKFGVDYSRPFYDKCMPLALKSKDPIIDIAIGKSSVAYIDSAGMLSQIKDGVEQMTSKRNKNLEGVEFYQITCFNDTFLALSKKGSIFSWSYDEDYKHLGRNTDVQNPNEIACCSQQFPLLEEDNEPSREQSNIKSTKVLGCNCSEENTYLLTDKGEVLITGGNEYGTMGLAFGDLEIYEDCLPDTFDEFIMIPRLSKSFKMKVDSLATGFNHVLALSSGKVFSWGCNSSGQLGLGFFSHSEKYPEMIKTLENEFITKAAAGLTHSLILTDSGRVYSFGSAESGKLGHGHLANSISISEPKLIVSLKDITRVSCSVGHSMALNKSNRIFSWGDNWKGQLGNGNRENEHEPKELLGFIGWLEIACGVNHSLAVSTDHRAYHWGRVNMLKEEEEILQPLMVKGLEEIAIKAVYASDGYSVALVANLASIYTWGRQVHHRIAGAKNDVKDGDLTKATLFSITNEKVQNFSCASLHCCIVTDQNSVYTWGYLANGRLGESFKDTSDKVFNGHGLNMTKYFGVVDKDSEEVEENINDLQLMLQNEPEELTEANIREVDKQIAAKFSECIDEFIKLTEVDEEINNFMDTIQYKMLMRLQQKPLDCLLIENNGVMAQDIQDKLICYGSVITTYQVHPCYTFKLLFRTKLKDEQRMEMMNLIYSDMEDNEKLIYTCMYLSQMILKQALDTDGVTFETIFDSASGQIYKQLIIKMILASSQDMLIMRALATEMLLNLSNQVNQDELGVDIDPVSACKSTNLTNKMTAYQNNRTIIDRRMVKLKSVLFNFSKSFIKLKPSRETDMKYFKMFSPLIRLVLKDFLNKCSKKFSLKLAKFDYTLEHIKKVTHTVLDMIFAPVCLAIHNPHEFYVVVENKQACSERNLNSLCKAVECFFNGKILEDSSGDRWLNEINHFNCDDQINLQRKVEMLEYLCSEKQEIKGFFLETNFKESTVEEKREFERKLNQIVESLYRERQELEGLYLESMFKDSLSQFDRIVSVNGRNLIKLHSITDKNLDILRVNNPSYDPLIFLCKQLGPAPSFKIFNQNEHVNLTLFTRALRQDQSIVRCPNCQMLIPREMAPSDFKPVIEIYDPMPPNSPQFLFTKILATSCKKLQKGRIDEFLKAFELRCHKYIKDYQAVDSVRYLLNLVDTNIAAENEIPIDTNDEIQINFITKEREIVLRKIEEECKIEYLRRRQHRRTQEKLTKIFNRLLDMLTHYKTESFFNETNKKELMFNVEYGGCNRDLEAFSDSVMFGIFLNKIRDYTMKKEMSINLYESLKGEMNNSLRGFMKRTLSELKRKKYFDADPLIPAGMKDKNIVFSFEIDNGDLIIIVAHSPGKLNICGRDEFRHEELLIYAKIHSADISKLRDEVKKGEEDSSP